MLRRAVPLLLLSFACRAEAPKVTAAPVVQDVLRPIVVERSGEAPQWITHEQREAARGLEVVGSAEAATLEAAKEQATRDLLSAIAGIVSVDVESEFDDHATSKNGVEHQEVSERVRSRARAAISGIKSDAIYWERFGPSILSSGGTFRFHTHAFVEARQLAEARALKQATRREQIGRPAIVLLPFGGDASAAGLQQDVAYELAAPGEALVPDPAVVRSLMTGSEIEGRARVSRALLPELMVSARITRSGRRIRARLTYYRGDGDHPFQNEVLEFEAARVASLGAFLAGKIATVALQGKSPKITLAARPNVEQAAPAFEAYHQAFAEFEQGANDRALERISDALRGLPEEPRFHLRLGRILERIGHYARLPAIGAAASVQVPNLLWCGSIGVQAEERARELLAARAARDAAPAPTEVWWSNDTPVVEAMLHLLMIGADLSGAREAITAPQAGPSHGARAGPTARSARQPAKQSAIEAYVRARALARARNDTRTEVEALLAGGDLAARVDRLDQALYLYQLASGLADTHPDLRARATIGFAVVGKKRGFLPWAALQLEAARLIALRIGDKPLLLEIDNELGAIQQTLENDSAAEAAYRRAERLAIELGNDYLRAAVGNNLGTFAAAQGRTATAEARFLRAQQVLTAIGEAEGTISSALNLGWTAALRGDGEIAGSHFASAEHKIESTAQETRLAEAWSHRGMVLLARGEAENGLEKLAAARRLLLGLGRALEAERLTVAIFAAEYSVEELTPYFLDCMSRRYWQWDARVIASPWDQIPATPRPARRIRGGPRVTRNFAEDMEARSEPWPRWKRTLRGDPKIADSPLIELELTLGAATVLALSDWESDPSWTPSRVRTEKAVLIAPPIYAVHPPAVVEPEVFPDEYLEDDLERPHYPPPPRSSQVEPSVRESAPSMALPGVDLEIRSHAGRKEPAAKPEAPSRQVQFERILNTFVVSAGGTVLLSPEIVRAQLRSGRVSWAREILDELALELDRRSRPRLAAAAELNGGALAWFDGDSERAYQTVMSARRRFAEAGDAIGMIRAQEWIAFFLEESGAGEIAANERAIAAALKQRLRE